MDFSHSYAIRVGATLITWRDMRTYAQWLRYSSVLNARLYDVKVQELAQPPTPRSGLSLAKFYNKLVFAIGGYNPSNFMNILGSVDVYSICENKWLQDVPDLNVKRQQHSSCCLGDYIYVCCGWGPQNLDSIERIDVRNLFTPTDFRRNFMVKWELLEIDIRTREGYY